ncbi:hypothetical protein V494_05835 [Pseudogymnoascus sp. VKM F-4513 (FW-928)]|nr:hypothetical protein V494_05835 [Pseudogymnoascus sp. VKM F-4513 (FW-928)]
MSIEMADQADFDHSGLQEVANAVRNNSGTDDLLGSTNQKRKREATDQDGSADTARRPGSKRSFQNAQKNDGSDQSANAFLDAQHEGNAGVESLQEYSNLQDQNIENQNGSSEHANATSTAAAALGIYPTMTIPQPTGVQFQTQGSDGDANQDSFMDTSQQNESYMDNSTAGTGRQGSGSKPAVGSEEWHKVRKDNHKEVERRRRETINEGINELAKIVPGCEKNKGSILQRAVSFITQLKENEDQNIEKWTLEKLLTEQAIAELSASNDKLKAECERAWREVETWKKTCQSAGLAPKKEDAAES